MSEQSAIPAKLGVRLPNSGPFADARNVIAIAESVDAAGYDRVWVHDHISWPREQLTHFATGSLEACADQDPNFFESVTTAAYLLGRLRRAGVGIAGLVLPFRNPQVLVKQLVAAEQLGGQRMIVAVGIGAIPSGFEALGVPFRRRGAITTGALRVMRAILAEPDGEARGAGVVAGTYFPAPQSLPVWVTGSSAAAVTRAAELGDGWMTVYRSPAELAEEVQRVRGAVEAQGRDPEAFDIGFETYVTVAATTAEAQAIAARSLGEKFGSVERGLEVCVVGNQRDVAEKLASYAEAGAKHLELKFIGHDVASIQEMIGLVAEIALP